MDANVHELIAQHAREVDKEHQLEEESDLITMDKSLKIPMLMPAASHPPILSAPTTSPLLFPLGPHLASMARINTLMGELEVGPPLENVYVIGSRLNKAQPRTRINPTMEKGSGPVAITYGMDHRNKV